MGRRHFHHVSQSSDHLADAACRVVSGAVDIWPPHETRRHLAGPPGDSWYEEPATPTKRQFVPNAIRKESWNSEPEPQRDARRRYPNRREASPDGATRDFTSSCLRRACSAPSSPRSRAQHQSRKHFLEDHYHLVEELPSHPRRKRHVPQRPQGHLGSASAQVVWDPVSRGTSRRHCPELVGRCINTIAAERGTLPAQRRHLLPDDHLIGPYVHHGDPERLVCGHTKARDTCSAACGSDNVAAVLSHENAQQQGPDSAAKNAPSRRVLESEGNLLGGYLWSSRDTPTAPSRAEPFFSKHHYDEPPPNLLGGSLRPSSPPWHEAVVPKIGPEDHLIGSAFRASSVPQCQSRAGCKPVSVSISTPYPAWM